MYAMMTSTFWQKSVFRASLLTRSIVFAGIIATCILGSAQIASAQFVLNHVPEPLHTNQIAKIVVGLIGEEKFEGSYLALPITWRLLNVSQISSEGVSDGFHFKKVDEYNNRYYLFSDDLITSSDQIVIEIETSLKVSSGF